MKKNKKLIIGIALMILALLLCGFTLYYKNNNIDKNYKYKIHYFDGYVPGYNYYIYIYDNDNIKVVSQAGCSLVECYNGTKTMPKYTKTINFSKENTDFIIKHFKDQFALNSKNEIYISSHDVSEYEKAIFSSLIYDDEKYLEKIK